MGMLTNTALLLFGIFASAAILGISFTKRNIGVLLLFCLVINAVQFYFYSILGLRGAQWMYPIMTHVPSVLLFTLHFKRRLHAGIFAVLSAYLCCQLSKWLGLLVLEISGKMWISYAVRCAATIAIGYVIIRYFASSIAVILTKPVKTVLIFGILPAAYYLFDYIATVYTDLLYSGSEVVFEFLPFILCIAYLFFSIVYFKEYEEKCEAEQYNRLMELKRIQSEKEIEAIKRSEHAVSMLRHDMRHFMNNIVVLINQGDSEKAKAYISEIIKSADKTATQRYCENEIVNMIISSYENQLKELEINLCHSIQIPRKLHISDIDLTSILSNGIENAINAVAALEKDQRRITLDLRMNDDKLLLSIKNPFAGRDEMTDGIPRAKGDGHGLGTQSIKYITEKLSGNCQFLAKDGQFALRVVL